MNTPRGLLLAVSLAVGLGLTAEPAVARLADPDAQAAGMRSAEGPPSGKRLSGRIIVLDPGHQLGNHNFPDKINRLVPAGGFKKPCNTTGTATDGGYPEATFTFAVSRLLRKRLVAAGADVVMTRKTNSEKRWGPCINVRGRAGNKAGPDHTGADLKISVHGDGNIGGGPGFHVIAPTDRKPWTHDIYKPSRRLAKVVRHKLHKGAHLPYAGYIAGGDGLDFRSDLGTLNLSDIPTVMVEMGNMRSAADAHRMTTVKGRKVYARALFRAIRAYLA